MRLLKEDRLDHISGAVQRGTPFLQACMLQTDTAGIEFHLSPGDWIRLLGASSFKIEDLIEVYPPDGVTA